MSEEIKLTSAQRAAAIDRTAENIALLSGAGCGKTYVLARRFTELLMSERDAADPTCSSDHHATYSSKVSDGVYRSTRSGCVVPSAPLRGAFRLACRPRRTDRRRR